MDQDTIIQYVVDTFDGVNVVTATEGLPAGDTFFIYDPDRNLEPQRQFPFATIVTKDYGDFDRASDLDRPGVYRLNIGVPKQTFERLFGPAKELGDEFDFESLDTILPHPVYAPQSWICVLNPSDATFESLRPLL